MPKIHKRVPRPPVAEPDPIYEAIEHHFRLWAKGEVALTPVFNLEGNKLRKAEWKKALRISERAFVAAKGALDALYRTQPNSVEGLAAVALYLRARAFSEDICPSRNKDFARLDAISRMAGFIAVGTETREFRRVRKIAQRLCARSGPRKARWLKAEAAKAA